MTDNILKKHKHKEVTLSQVIILIICFVVCLITIYPMWYVLIMSLSTPDEVLRGGITIWPHGFYLGSYNIVLSDPQLFVAIRNSILYVVAGTILMLITSILGAYPLIHPNLIGRKYLVAFLIVPMYISGGMIPTFLLVSKLGMYNTPWALILPGCYGLMNIILVRTFFTTIPHEVAESAQIDGASHFRTMVNIYIPLSRPVLAVISIYTIVGIWNSWFDALIYTTDPSIQPLQMLLQQILVTQQVDLTKLLTQEEYEDAMQKLLTGMQLKYAMIIIVSLPIICVYPFFQKHFVKGVMLGSLKG